MGDGGREREIHSQAGGSDWEMEGGGEKEIHRLEEVTGRGREGERKRSTDWRK